MNCPDVEILLAEYVDGTLRREARVAVKEHLESCLACRDLAHDAAGAVAFIERASRVEAYRDIQFLERGPQCVPVGLIQMGCGRVYLRRLRRHDYAPMAAAHRASRFRHRRFYRSYG